MERERASRQAGRVDRVKEENEKKGNVLSVNLVSVLCSSHKESFNSFREHVDGQSFLLDEQRVELSQVELTGEWKRDGRVEYGKKIRKDERFQTIVQLTDLVMEVVYCQGGFSCE